MRIDRLTPDDLHPWADLLAASFDRPVQQMQALITYLHTGFPVIAFGAWDADRLAAQYCCLMTSLHVPGMAEPVQAGMSVNMTTHPDYRGRGLIKQLAAPAYEAVSAQGGRMGVGFSNAEGVRVDRHSRGYGYHVVGRMRSALAICVRAPRVTPLLLTDIWPGFPSDDTGPPRSVRFVATEASVRHRFAQHPFRHYIFGVWKDSSRIRGLVVFRHVRMGGVAGAGLLSAYSDDLPSLMRRWLAALKHEGLHIVHYISSPASEINLALRQHTLSMRVPVSRSPHYLTIKPIDDALSPVLDDFARWDCTGGDIL